MAKIKLIENSDPAYKFKPTNRQPETHIGVNVNNEIKKQNSLRALAEVDADLSEEQKIRKKDVFELAKMEALVHNDDKLTAIFNKILEDDPQNKYGYHWNETVMNLLFNKYVLDNPVYFEKYKNAVPVEKKRRDMSGINQLRKDDGAENDDTNEQSLAEINLFGGGRFDTSRWFVQPRDFKPNDLLVFDAKTRSLIDIIDHRQLAQQIHKYRHLINKGIEILDPRGTTHANLKNAISRYKIPQEIVSSLKQILSTKQSGQMSPSLSEIEIQSDMLETTGAVSSGSFEKPLEEEEIQIQETTTSASSGQYSQPAIWAKDKKNMRFARKPAWSGGEIVSETYLTDPKCFHKYLKSLEIDDFVNETYDMAETIYSEAPVQMDAFERKKFVQHFKNLMAMTAKRMGLEPEEYKQHFESIIDDLKKEILNVDPNATFDDVSNQPPVQEHHLDSIEDKTNFVSQNLANLSWSKGLEKASDEIDSLYQTIEKEQGIGENDQQVIQAIKKDISTQRPMTTRPDNTNQFGGNSGIRTAPNSNKQFGGNVNKPMPDNTKQFGGKWNEAEITPLDEFNLDEYSFDDDNLHFSDIKTRGSRGKIRLGDLVKFAQTNPSIDQINAFASGYKMSPNDIHELATHYLENNLGYSGGVDTPEQKTLLDLISTIDDSLQSQAPQAEPVGDIEESMIDQQDQSMSMGGSHSMSMANKSDDMGGMSMGGNVDDISHQEPSDLSVSTMDNLDNPLNMNEERKTPSQMQVDRIKKENEKIAKVNQKEADGLSNQKVYGFKPNPNDMSKATQYPADKDFYINSKDTKGTSFEEIENKSLKDYNEKKGITSDKQVKRVNSTEENKALAMNRGLGMQDIVYDNKPSQKFEDRMKKDMGDEMYKIRQDKMKMQADMPMYNKEDQPTSGEVHDNKFAKKYNIEDMNESLSASYFDSIGKRKIVEFKIGNVKLIESIDKTFIKLEMSGFANSFNKKNSFTKNQINENSQIKQELDEFDFFIRNSEIFKMKKIKLNENQMNEKFKKMMHLMKYDPTKYIKK